jgi:hypothetical protein
VKKSTARDGEGRRGWLTAWLRGTEARQPAELADTAAIKMQQTLLLRVWLLAAAAGGAGLATPVPSAGGRPAATTAAVSASWPWNWSTVKPFNYGNNGSGMDSAAELRRKARYSMLFTDGSEDQGYNATLGPAWDGQRRLSEQVAAYAAAAPGVPAFLYRPASTIPPTFPQASVVNNSDKQHWWLRDAATGLPTPLTLNLSVPEAAEYWIEEVVGTHTASRTHTRPGSSSILATRSLAIRATSPRSPRGSSCSTTLCWRGGARCSGISLVLLRHFERHVWCALH